MTSPKPSDKLPRFLYGTAWKGEDTRRLVRLALEAGFRAIDTANQRKHYFEPGVGEALKQTFAEGLVSRGDVFIQTKFTYPHSQDHRLPYDPHAEPAKQVRQSFAASLEHLGIESLDSYILHGPSVDDGLAPTDLEVWRTIEELQAEGRTRFIGVSNISFEQLELLCSHAKKPPAFVQNRCFASTGWDREVRGFCRQYGIVYQGFSLLTANARELLGDPFRQLVQRVGGTIPQVVFSFAHHMGILPLTGTTDPAHMREDLASAVELSDADLDQIETIGE